MPAEADRACAQEDTRVLLHRATIVPFDTTAEAHRLQGEIYRRMGGPARLAIAFQLTETVRRLALAGIRARHPDYTDEQVFQAWGRLNLGDDSVRAIWPDCRLVDP
ncbi:MAG TPA: hypothetical protein VLD67_03305 [Vicinamibacterales bacterium]|nr:hypothetical protein [Vicinamibacterales bacterium]